MVAIPKEGQLVRSSHGPPQEVVQGQKTSLVYMKNYYKAVSKTAVWCKARRASGTEHRTLVYDKVCIGRTPLVRD